MFIHNATRHPGRTQTPNARKKSKPQKEFFRPNLGYLFCETIRESFKSLLKPWRNVESSFQNVLQSFRRPALGAARHETDFERVWAEFGRTFTDFHFRAVEERITAFTD